MATGQGSPHLPVRKTLIYDIHTKVFGFRIESWPEFRAHSVYIYIVTIIFITKAIALMIIVKIIVIRIKE